MSEEVTTRGSIVFQVSCLPESKTNKCTSKVKREHDAGENHGKDSLGLLVVVRRRVILENKEINDKVSDFDQHEHAHADEHHEERLLVIEERTPNAKQCQKHHNDAKDNAKKTSEAFDEAKQELKKKKTESEKTLSGLNFNFKSNQLPY
jgi:hypothetical protein